MRQPNPPSAVPREVPVRWLQRSWEAAIAGAGLEPVPVTTEVVAAPVVRRVRRGSQRITVTTRKAFSQPSRAQRHRR